MKRLILTLAAALAVAGPLSFSEATAKDQRGGWEQRGGGRGGGGYDRPDRGGGRWRNDERPRQQRQWERPRPDSAPRMAPPVIEDHARYRLRTPPRGYSWVRVRGGYALVDERTGRIYDMVPAPGP